MLEDDNLGELVFESIHMLHKYRDPWLSTAISAITRRIAREKEQLPNTEQTI